MKAIKCKGELFFYHHHRMLQFHLTNLQLQITQENNFHNLIQCYNDHKYHLVWYVFMFMYSVYYKNAEKKKFNRENCNSEYAHRINTYQTIKA